MRWHHEKDTDSGEKGRITAWQRASRRDWENSSVMTRPWREALAKAGLRTTLVPYCLRHSSIVHALQANVPIRVAAAAHDTSLAMIERHYAAVIVDASEMLLRAAASRLVAPAGQQ
jgi:hypothetical protein